MTGARTAPRETRGVPVDPGPSRWLLPDPDTCDEPSGVVGFGADLAAPTLVDAYRRGMFPWPHEGVSLPWFSPDPRGVLVPRDVKVSRSLRQRLRRTGWATTVDAAFEQVIRACAERSDDEGTWITRKMRRAYNELARLGWAHSVEVWDGDRLVGGLYGVQLGGVFTGESMFHREPDGSKVALVDLCARLAAAGGSLVDVQILTPHLATMGALEIPRAAFLETLRRHRDDPVELPRDRLPVSRLATGLRGPD